MAKLALDVRSSPEEELHLPLTAEPADDHVSSSPEEHRLPGPVGVLVVSAVSVALWAAILNAGINLFH
jgi:hypothetical protein